MQPARPARRGPRVIPAPTARTERTPSGTPAPGVFPVTANPNDMFLDTTTDEVYQYLGGAWTDTGAHLKGNDGPAGPVGPAGPKGDAGAQGLQDGARGTRRTAG